VAARKPPPPANRALHDSTSEVEAVQLDDFAEPTLRMPPVRPRGGPSTEEADESTKKVPPRAPQPRDVAQVAFDASDAPTDKVKHDASAEFHESVEALARLHLRLGRIRDGRAPWLRDEIAALLAKLGKHV
jgi:hypothetical protein